MYEMFEV